MNAMMKLVATVLVITGTTGLGFYKIVYDRQTIENMEQVLEMLIRFQQEITYSHITMSAICSEIELQMNAPFSDFLHRIHERMNSKMGEKISDIWESETAILFMQIHMPDYIQYTLKHVMDDYTCMDKEVQVGKLHRSIEKLRDEIGKKRMQQENKNRIYLSVGIMSGLLCCILFI